MEKLSWKSRSKWYPLLAFLFPSLVMLAILIYREVFPFGDESMLHMDMYHQYMPFFGEFLHKLQSGESLTYSWNVGMGSNFLALFSYYLASPMNWLVIFCPEGYLMEFMTYMTVIKIGLCGVTFYLYLRYHFKEERYSMVLISCFYALSGFIAAYNWDTMWLDNVILAPLIILGLERLFYEKKYLLYTVTLGMSILSDYYLSIMICIFVVLYFVVLLILNPEKWKAVIPFAVCSLLAGGIGAVLLLPTYFALHFTEFGEFNFPKKVSSYFSVWDVVARHFMNVATEQKLDHWPNIYCGVMALFGVPLYVLNRQISFKEKFAKLTLAAFMILSFCINLLVFIWHGFNYPDSLPARQSFLYIFLILVLCYEAFTKLSGVSKREIAGSFLGAMGFVILCEKLIGYEDDFALSTYLYTALFLTIQFVFWYLYRKGMEHGAKQASKRMAICIAVIATVAVLFESGINMKDTSLSVTGRSAYLKKIPAYEALVERTKEKESDFYRFEKWKRKTKNDGTLAGYPTASVFSSTANSYIGDFYEGLGMGHSKVFYCFDGATPFTAALLNVKYMFSEQEDMESSQLYSLVDEENGVYLYECHYTLPVGYIAPEGFDIDAVKDNQKDREPFRTQNQMVRKLLNGELLFDEVMVHNNVGGVSLVVEEPGHYYLYSCTKKTKNITVSVNGEEKEYKSMGNGYIISAGYLETGDVVEVTCEEMTDFDMIAARLNVEALAEVTDILSEQSMVVDSYDADSLSGHIEVKQAGELILTIPYEPGWTLLVDGVETEKDWCGQAFIGVWLEEGTHAIELVYEPEGLTAGAIISICSGLAVLGYFLWGKKEKLLGYKKMKSKKNK